MANITPYTNRKPRAVSFLANLAVKYLIGPFEHESQAQPSPPKVFKGLPRYKHCLWPLYQMDK